MAPKSSEKNARIEAEKLFLKLRRSTQLSAIKVMYPLHFPAGEFVVSMTIPLSETNREVALQVERMHRHYFYQGILICDKDKRDMAALWLAWRFRGIHPNDPVRPLEYARTLAGWAEEIFQNKTIILAVPNLRKMTLKK